MNPNIFPPLTISIIHRSYTYCLQGPPLNDQAVNYTVPHTNLTTNFRLKMSDSSIQKKPSWVNPAHDQTLYHPSGPSENKQTVTIKYSSPSTRPPVYVATSLTAPPWEPIEMEYVIKDDELAFSKRFVDVEAGTHQYKFRLGPGDWWVLDGNAPTGKHNHMKMIARSTLTYSTSAR